MTENYKQLTKNVGQLVEANKSLAELSVWIKQFCTADLQGQMIHDGDMLKRELQFLQAALKKAASQVSNIIEHE